MNFDDVNSRGLVMLGCGKMGSAMLAGWLDRGLDPGATWVLDPFPSSWLLETGVRLGEPLPTDPAVAIIAVKPQIMEEALPALLPFSGGQTLFISVAAGTRIARYTEALGPSAPVIRAMPNTPAAIGQGITALIGSPGVGDAEMSLAELLLGAVGKTVRLDNEAQMDAVTGLSGSGPAYVFHLIECLAAAGQAQGLQPELAMDLAISTVAGAGALARDGAQSPEQLRINVTSPNGTTQAGLDVLMSQLPDLVRATVRAATDRSKELSNDG
ncbi:MAG: pyrroline-5-carboxylate reductase [Pseudomonadota bacterium]